MKLLSLTFLAAISYLGYAIFKKLSFPAPRIIGPLFMVASVQLLGISFAAPDFLKSIFSVIFGIHLGLRFDKSALQRLKRLFIPALALSLTYVVITVIYGTLLMRISNMDQNTSFLAVIPGGIAEAGVLAVAYKAELAQVSAFQLLRYLSIVIVFPTLIRLGAKHFAVEQSNDQTHYVLKKEPSELTFSFLWLYIAGIIGATVFYLIELPAALLLGSAVGVSCVLLLPTRSFALPPVKVYEISQLGMGALIGLSFTRQSLLIILSEWKPMLIMTCAIISTSIVLGFIFSKIFKLNYITGLLSVLPGGLSTMILFAEDLNADIVSISTLQLARLLTAVAVIPVVYAYIL